MFGQKNIIVVWVAGRQLVIAGGKMAELQTIELPGNVVSNLEVLDQDALYALIKDWAVKRPAGGAEIVWIFGHDVYYEHTMQESEKVQWESTVVRFLDLLPFEEVESRVFTGLTGTKVVAVNKDFYNSLKRGFALQGYVTRAETVASELGKYSEAPTIDKAVAAHVLKNLDTIEKNRLVGEELNFPEISLTPTLKKKNSSLPILIGVFAVLLGVLGYMVVTMNR